jgi:hypothetical protein
MSLLKFAPEVRDAEMLWGEDKLRLGFQFSNYQTDI